MISQDLIGKRFGKLTVVDFVRHPSKNKNFWMCKCDCGNTTYLDAYRLKSGHTKSCGCLNNPTDLIGMRFGNFVVIEKLSGSGNQKKWKCKCDCGNERACYQTNLIRGTSTSCGCLRSYYAKQSRNCHGESTSILYKKWTSMKTRCFNKNNPTYKSYGGRGITICKEWLDFWTFREWAYEKGYKDGLSIERIDVNGNYCPENCCWIEVSEQANNKRRSAFIEYGGKRQTASQWAKELGVGKDTITYRVRAGWTPEECLFGKEKNVSHCRPRMDIPNYLKEEMHNAKQ